MVVDLKANELVLKASDSNYFAEEANVDGKLILTNQRVYFKTKEDKNSGYNLEILPNQIKEILQRGHRADTYQQGHGIGLAIVKDLVDSYQGKLNITGKSSLGGANFSIKFNK